MAIDHGLGGRDGEKSKKRREKKAKRTKMIARKALQRTKDGKKTEIVFDEKARVDYVANFHKRKQDRRRYGLAMEVLKKEKAHKQMRKDQRSAMKSQLDEVSAACSKAKELASETDADEHDTAISTAGGEGADPADADAAALQRYEDASTVAMFGSAVDVVVDDNLFQDDAEDVDDADEDPSLEASIAQLKNQKREREPSRLQRALRKAKFMMTQKKSKRSSSGSSSSSSSSNDETSQSGKRNSSKGATSKLLLSKVLGKPVHGRKSSDAKKASKRH